MRIAFHAPLKGPDHPVPSGDRAMARLLMKALRMGGHDLDLVSTFRSFQAAPDPVAQARIEAAAAIEAEAIAARWAREPSRPPDVWFTYHPFYKAPDFLGPRLARRFGLVYATAEASHAGKRAAGPWAGWHAANEAALRTADLHVCLTPGDREGLARLTGGRARLVDLPPFIDAGDVPLPPRCDRARVELVTVAMMRSGDKLRSYGMLADALARLPKALSWRLAIVGDGPAAAEVRRCFAEIPPERLVWRGELPGAEVAAALTAADLYVWPGVNEAFGVAYLEAGAAGLPALAMRYGGIPSVVMDAETGLLTPAGDCAAYAAALARLITEGEARRRLGAAAHRFVTGERTVEAAAAILSAHLADVLARQGRRSA